MSYMAPGSEPYLDILRQLNTPGGGGGMVTNPVSVTNPITPLGGGGPATGFPTLPTNPITVQPVANAAAGGAGGGGGFISGLRGLSGPGGLGGGGELAGLGERLVAAPGGALTTYGLPVAAGIGTGMLADRAVKAAGLNHNSILSDVGEGAAGGAVTGAAIGALGLPIPLVGEVTTAGGAALGGLIGGGIGLAGHLFGGGGKGNKKVNYGVEGTNVMNEAQAAGLDPSTARDIYNQYGIYLRSQLATTRGTDQEQSTRQGAYQLLSQNLMGALQQQKAQEKMATNGPLGLGGIGAGSMTPSDYATIQALGAAYIKPYTDQSIATAKDSYNVLSGLADKVGGTYGDSLKAQAAALTGAAQRTALAYASQVQLTPTMVAFEEQQNQMKALANQLQSTAISNYLQGQGKTVPYTADWSGGGGAGLSGVLAGTAPASSSKK